MSDGQKARYAAMSPEERQALTDKWREACAKTRKASKPI